MPEDKINKIESAVDGIREDAHSLKEKVLLIEQKQERMHEDITGLTMAIEQNTAELKEQNQFIANRKGFVGGLLTALTAIGAIIGSAITIATQWWRG